MTHFIWDMTYFIWGHDSLHIRARHAARRLLYIRHDWFLQNPLFLFHSAPEASWRRGFDPCTPLLFDVYHYLEQIGYFRLVPEHAPGPSSQVLPGCRVRHPCYTKKLFVRVTPYYMLRCCDSILLSLSLSPSLSLSLSLSLRLSLSVSPSCNVEMLRYQVSHIT